MFNVTFAEGWFVIFAQTRDKYNGNVSFEEKQRQL